MCENVKLLNRKLISASALERSTLGGTLIINKLEYEFDPEYRQWTYKVVGGASCSSWFPSFLDAYVDSIL